MWRSGALVWAPAGWASLLAITGRSTGTHAAMKPFSHLRQLRTRPQPAVGHPCHLSVLATAARAEPGQNVLAVWQEVERGAGWITVQRVAMPPL